MRPASSLSWLLLSCLLSSSLLAGLAGRALADTGGAVQPARVELASQPPPPPGIVPLVGELKFQLRVVLIVNSGYQTATIVPGNVATFVVRPEVARSQFYLSPDNTVLGFSLTGLSVHGVDLSGGLDINLRSPQPLLTSGSISPQFYDVHIQLEGKLWRAIAGQYPDVLLPFFPDTTNSLPAGYVPGAIGYVRPQLRGEARFPFGEQLQAILKASLSEPVQTFNLPGDTLIGRQGGLPDGQLRVSIALGRSKIPWERPFEIGASGHLGRRRVTDINDGSTRQYRTWSMSLDARARAETGTLIKGRIWRGALLGDYNAGIFQTVDPVTRDAVRATGLWIELQQAFTDRWRATAGYGRDNPTDADLGPAGRTLNQAGFLNTVWDLNRTIGVAVEISRWATSFQAGAVSRAWRADTVLMLRF